MRIYISGGIAGFEVEERKQEFRAAASWALSNGHYPVNPFDCLPEQHPEKPCPKGYAQGEGHTSACHLRADLQALLRCDAILMLEGWELSRGARLEHNVAADCGLQIFYLRSSAMPTKEGGS